MQQTSASFNQRLLAQMVDLTIFFPAILLLDLLLPGNLFWFASATLYLLYAVAFESSKHRATPGKMLLRLEIVRMDQNTYTFSHTVARQALKGVSLLLFFSGFFMIYLHPRGQSLHDYFTRTRVISKINPRANW